MRILIINGSPAGDNSITLQTMRYIRKTFQNHDYSYINAGQKIKSYERDFTECKMALDKADLIVFCYPVYTFLVPSQLHRFIELMKDSGIDLSDKFATQLSTSKHFYDVTAHEFIRENCSDMKLKYIKGLSADMEDLLTSRGRKEAVSFFHHVLWSIEKGLYDIPGDKPKYQKPLVRIETIGNTGRKLNKKKVVIVTDLSEDNSRLKNMIERFRSDLPYISRVVNIRDADIKGGCLGCFNCAAEGKCIYKDDFERLLKRDIQTADATVYAFSIKDHSMGYLFKLYDDRQFCNGHRTVTMGKPVGYRIDGYLSNEPNLQTMIEARAQVGGNYLTFIAGNEADTEKNIQRLAIEMVYALTHNYTQPANFYGVGGLKIFRDLIYQMQGLMREDHRFYKKHGFYDFPQKNKGRIIGMYLVGTIMKNPILRKKTSSNMTKGMLMPYERVLRDPQNSKIKNYKYK